MTSIVRGVIIEQHLKKRVMSEYQESKYRMRVDGRADQGNHRSSTEYHQMASKRLVSHFGCTALRAERPWS